MPINDLLFSFQGRIRRSQWWAVQIGVIGLILVAVFAAEGLVNVLAHTSGGGKTAGEVVLSLLGIVLFPLMVWINLATSVKRLHDLNWTGWLVLLAFIPYVGGLFSLVCMGCLDGKPGRNTFGPSPKFPEQEADVFA